MCYGLSAGDVRTVFSDRVAALGGEVKDIFEDEGLLLARSVLPRELEVKPRDKVRCGVAVRFAGCELCVHPYTLRQVCTNGAIMVRSSRCVRVEITPQSVPCDVLGELEEAIAQCASPGAATEAVATMSGSTMDTALHLLPYICRHPSARDLVREILSRMAREADDSRFGLMNAVTSLARDTADPRRRWELE